jgi:hypothetical protein
MTIALTTPDEIGMWVLLSRRHQVQLHLKGIKVPGIVKWCKDNLGTGEGGKAIRTAKDAIVPIEYAISEAGGKVDYRLVNVQVMVKAMGLFHDQGIFSDMSEVEDNPDMVKAYQDGRLEIVLTTKDTRPANREVYVTS